MGEVRRGRISRAVYVRTVGQMLTRDWYALESCEVLTQLEMVEYLVSTFPDRFLSPGWAVRWMLDKAIRQVIGYTEANTDEKTRRIALFLRERQQGKTVADIARAWGLTRECVSRTVGRQALLLVTDRVLVIGRRKPDEKRSDEGAERPAPKRIA